MLNCKYIRGKRGQTSYFIIIGIIILMIVLLAYYVYQVKVDSQGDDVTEPQKTAIDSTILKEFVTGCIHAEAKDAVIKLGEHAGYIDPLNTELSGTDFVQGAKPTESDMISFPPGAQQKIPYWWYLKSENDKMPMQLSSKVPSRTDIERQVSTYVEKHLKNCLGNFNPVTKQGYDVDNLTSPNVTTKIAKKEVVVTADYELVFKNDDSETIVNSYYTKLDVNLLKTYKLASLIMYLEAEGQMLEYMTQYIISAYGGLDEEIPPIAAMDHGFSTKTWTKPSVKSHLQELLRVHVPLIQVNRTKGVMAFEENSTYQVFHFKQLNESFQDHYVNFLYLGWPIYMDISPSDGILLEPEVRSYTFPYDVLPRDQNNIYEFFYDVSFPAVVHISDTEAFKGEGYDFFIALESNIRDNIDMYDWFHGNGTIGSFDRSQVQGYAPLYSLPKHNCTETGTDWAWNELETFSDEGQCKNDCLGVCVDNSSGWICNRSMIYDEYDDCQDDASSVGKDCHKIGTDWQCELNHKTFDKESECDSDCHGDVVKDMTGVNSSKSLFCEENQRLSGNISIRVEDKETEEPVEDARISFGCGDYKECSVGMTSKMPNINEAELNARLPICLGGYLVVEREGFLPAGKFLTTDYGENKMTKVNLQKLYEINASFVKKQYDGFSLLGPEDAPGPMEEVVVNLDRVPQQGTNISIPYGRSYIFDEDETEGVIEIAPGRYRVNIQLIDNNETYIAPEVSNYGSKPEQWVSGLRVGASELSNRTAYWDVPLNVSNYTKVTLPILYLKTPATYDELNQLSDLSNYTKQYRADLEPVLS